MEISGYTLVNLEKFDRALNGTLKADSSRSGGVGKGAYFDEDAQVWKRDNELLSEEEVVKLEFALLAEYDKFAGTIRRGNDKVKNGSFWNYVARRPHEKPKVEFVFRFGNKVVTVPDGVELPGEVKAQKILKEVQQKEAEEVKEGKKVKRAKK